MKYVLVTLPFIIFVAVFLYLFFGDESGWACSGWN